MSYAIRNDKVAFRAVAGPEDVGPHEYWSAAPIEVVPMPPTPEELVAQEREWRDGVLSELVWLRDRHRDQLEIGSLTTLTTDQFPELLVFMQALRDWPQSEAFPARENRPIAPSWVEGVLSEP